VNEGAGPEPARTLPVFGVFAEALVLSARNSARMFVWTLPVGVAGVLGVGAAVLLREVPFASLAALCAAAAYLVVLACAFSVRVHRMLLVPGERPVPFGGQFFTASTWRYVRGSLVVALMAVIPMALGVAAASFASDAGLGFPLNAILAATLPYLAAQAVIAPRQILYLTDLSLRSRGSWAASTAMARGFHWRLRGVNLLGAGFSLVVTLFAGWLVGMAFAEGPQWALEFLTLAMGLPAQLVCFTCLQAACYRRLSLDPVP